MTKGEEKLDEEPSSGKKTAVTIYDIAAAAQVSPSTVSRALHKPGRIAKHTEARIRAVAEELGYRINTMARALPTGRTGTVALILSDVTNPVFFDVVRSAQHVVNQHDYSMVLAESQESVPRERELIERLRTAVDGFLLVATRLPTEEIVELAREKHVLVANRVVHSVRCVVPDIVPGISAALQHLADLGHRNVAFLSGPELSWMNRYRYTAFGAQARRVGINLTTLGPVQPTVPGGRRQLQAVRDAKVTAVIAYNDLIAIGLMQAAGAAGLRIPRDLSVIGVDDIFGADFTVPALSTIRLPMAGVGRAAAEQLLTLVHGSADLESPRLTAQFIQRDTTAAPRKPAG